MSQPTDERFEEFERVLRLRGGFEAVDHQHSANQVRLLGRVRAPSTNSWLVVVHHLLSAADKADGWSVDISKQLFLRGGKVMFGWRLILQGTDIAERLTPIIQLIAASPRVRAIIEEQALPGASSSRNAPSLANGGKGAQSSLKSTVGPMAIAALRRE